MLTLVALLLLVTLGWVAVALLLLDALGWVAITLLLLDMLGWVALALLLIVFGRLLLLSKRLWLARLVVVVTPRCHRRSGYALSLGTRCYR